MAIRLNYYLSDENPDVLSNLDKYLNINMSYITWDYKIYSDKPSSIDRTTTSIKMDSCSENRFANMTSKTEILGISKGFLCPIDLNHTLLGGVSSRNRQFFRLTVEPCN